MWFWLSLVGLVVGVAPCWDGGCMHFSCTNVNGKWDPHVNVWIWDSFIETWEVFNCCHDWQADQTFNLPPSPLCSHDGYMYLLGVLGFGVARSGAFAAGWVPSAGPHFRPLGREKWKEWEFLGNPNTEREREGGGGTIVTNARNFFLFVVTDILTLSFFSLTRMICAHTRTRTCLHWSRLTWDLCSLTKIHSLALTLSSQRCISSLLLKFTFYESILTVPHLVNFLCLRECTNILVLTLHPCHVSCLFWYYTRWKT